MKIITLQRNGLFLVVAIAATLLGRTNAQAQPDPTAAAGKVQGEIIRSLPTLPRTLPKEELDEESISVLKPPLVGGPIPLVKTIRLSGFESDIDKDVHGYQLVSKYFSLQLTQEDWKRISGEIWEGYRDMGKLVRVDLVAHDSQFIVTVSQLRIRKITIKNSNSSNSQVEEEEIKRIEKLMRQHITEGQHVDLFNLKKFLLHLDYRAKEVISTQIISAATGVIDIIFIVSKRERKSPTPWQFGVDNFGLNGFGKYRANGRYYAPLLSAGDNFALQALFSAGQAFGNARYDFPLGFTSLRSSVWGNMLHYKVDSKTAQTGQATMGGIDVSYPIFFREGGLITTSIGYEFKGTKDYLPMIFTSKWINNFHLRASGENFVGGQLSVAGDLTIGNLNIGGNGVASLLDDYSAKTKGNFGKFYGEGQFFQPVTTRSIFTANLKGQFSNKNLDSLEKFSFAGVNGVRAYNSDVGIGDGGLLANISYSMSLNTKLPMKVGIFYDHAFIKVSHSPWDTEFDNLSYSNNYQLNGAGLQLTVAYKELFFNATVAHPVDKKPIAPDEGLRLWAQVTYSF